MSAKEKKELIGLALSVVIAVVLSLFTISGDEPQWLVPLIFVGVAAVSLFKYLRARDEARAEHRLRELGEGR